MGREERAQSRWGLGRNQSRVSPLFERLHQGTGSARPLTSGGVGVVKGVAEVLRCLVGRAGGRWRRRRRQAREDEGQTGRRRHRGGPWGLEEGSPGASGQLLVGRRDRMSRLISRHLINQSLVHGGTRSGVRFRSVLSYGDSPWPPRGVWRMRRSSTQLLFCTSTDN